MVVAYSAPWSPVDHGLFPVTKRGEGQLFSRLGSAAISNFNPSEKGKITFDRVIDAYSFGLTEITLWVSQLIGENIAKNQI
jgi:hypothetical protein